MGELALASATATDLGWLDMPNLHEQYTEELRDEFGYLATWLPNARLALGDVGVLRRDAFERVTSLRQLGVDFDELAPEGQLADYQYASSGVTDTAIDSAADAGALDAGIADLRARMAIVFQRAHGVVFQARGCQVRQIADRVSLQDAILALDGAGKWSRQHVVITELVSTGPASVVISSSAGGRIEFKAKGGVLPATLPLASAAGSLQVMSASGIATQIVGSERLTPLFRAAGLRRRLFGGSRFATRSGQATDDDHGASAGELLLAEMQYEDVTGASRTLALD